MAQSVIVLEKDPRVARSLAGGLHPHFSVDVTGSREELRVEMQAAMSAQCRKGNLDCTALAVSGVSGMGVSPSVIESLLPGHRPYVERVLEVAIPLSRRLKRAVARRGSFACSAAAAALLRQSAERFIHTNWPAAS